MPIFGKKKSPLAGAAAKGLWQGHIPDIHLMMARSTSMAIISASRSRIGNPLSRSGLSVHCASPLREYTMGGRSSAMGTPVSFLFVFFPFQGNRIATN